jgi:hypothetical protein
VHLLEMLGVGESDDCFVGLDPGEVAVMGRCLEAGLGEAEGGDGVLVDDYVRWVHGVIIVASISMLHQRTSSANNLRIESSRRHAIRNLRAKVRSLLPPDICMREQVRAAKAYRMQRCN